MGFEARQHLQRKKFRRMRPPAGATLPGPEMILRVDARRKRKLTVSAEILTPTATGCRNLLYGRVLAQDERPNSTRLRPARFAA